MTLVDAVYINASGGLVLLKYLIASMDRMGVKYELLLDKRVENNIEPKVKTCFTNGGGRKVFYKKNETKYNKVLCFGNVPPPIRLKATVYVYFHNVFLLRLPKKMPLIQKVLSLMKRIYIKSFRKNADYWMVQTRNTHDILRNVLNVKEDNIIVCPFYDDTVFKGFTVDHKKRTDYAYVANYVPAKNHDILIKAWCVLAQRGMFPVLHLTLSDYPKSIEKLLEKARTLGAKIINHGYCTLSEVAEIYHKSKAIIYPSENESFGLGIIEGITEGCDLLAPDLPYIKSIATTSMNFELSSVSIANIVNEYDKGEKYVTSVTVKNEIKKIINILK